jgi:high frequency lysogenization protein
VVEELSRMHERVIGIAGVLQAARLVQQLARTGVAPEPFEKASVESLLVMDAPTTQEVFGGLGGVSVGLEMVRDKLVGARSELDVEVLKYSVALTSLQRSLYRKTRYLDLLVEGLEGLKGLTGDSLYLACAEVYMSAISPLSPKIYVQGEQGFLQHEGVPEKVRTLLLAGIRASVLWQQKGGGRLDIMLHRKRYRELAAELIVQGLPTVD